MGTSKNTGNGNSAAALEIAKAKAKAEAEAKALAEKTKKDAAAANEAANTPKASEALVKIGNELLKSNPDMEVVYITSDGRGFYEPNDAENYARTLKNTAVTPVKK